MPWSERILTDDATAASASTGTFQTKREYPESIKADKSVIASIERLEPSVRVDGNTAIITGINGTRGRDAQGTLFDRRALFTGTWVNRDGRWMVRAFQGTVLP